MLVGLTLSTKALAYDIEVDGMSYNIHSLDQKTVCLMRVSKDYSRKDLIIPDEIVVNNVVFKVDSICAGFGCIEDLGGWSTNHYPLNSITINKHIKVTSGHDLGGARTKSFFVDGANPYLQAVDGIIYSKDLKTLYNYPSLKEDSIYIMPDFVEFISHSAFVDLSYLEKIVFNNTVENLPDYLFMSNDLKSLKLSDRIKGWCESALWNLSKIEEIILPKELSNDSWYSKYYGDDQIIPRNVNNVTISNSAIINYYTTIKGYKNYIFSSLSNLHELHVKDSHPTTLMDGIFSENQFFSITIYVPNGCAQKYRETEGWNKFYNIKEEDTASDDSKEKCSAPEIVYSNGKILVTSKTDGALCHTTIEDSDIKTYYTSEIPLSATYNITSYATKDGYEKSDKTTATLYFIEGRIEGETGIAQVPAKRGIVVSAESGSLSVSGLNAGETVAVYNLQGVMLGKSTASGGTAQFSINRKHETVIIKVGEESIKVVL